MSTRKQAGRFLVAGVLTVIVDLITYLLLMEFGVQLDIAKGISFATGTIFAYFANSSWTFTASRNLVQFAKFLALYISSLGINVVVNRLVVDGVGDENMRVAMVVAFLTATAVSAASNFIGMKYFVFASQ